LKSHLGPGVSLRGQGRPEAPRLMNCVSTPRWGRIKERGEGLVLRERELGRIAPVS